MASKLARFGILGLAAVPMLIFAQPPTAEPEKPGPSPISESSEQKKKKPKEGERPPPARPPGQDKDRGDRKNGAHVPKMFREKFEKLSEEERKRFLENWKRWKALDSEERNEIRERAMGHYERIHKAIESALQKTGLELGKEDREAFVRRYREERRKIEEQLRAEMEDKRRGMVAAMIERLKQEFGGKAKAAATPAEAEPTPNPSAP